jgi:hypothetical protein
VTIRPLPLHSSDLIAGWLIVLFVTVLAGFSMVMVHILGLGPLPSLWFFSVFALGFVVANASRPKLEPRLRHFKLRVVFIVLAIDLIILTSRLTAHTSALEIGLYLLIAGFAFGLNWARLQKLKLTSKRIMVLLGILGLLIFGFLLTNLISNDFAPRETNIENTLSLDERSQLEMLNLKPQLTAFNSKALKTQLKANLGRQLQDFGWALKNSSIARKVLLEDPSTPSNWRTILERGGLRAVIENHFLKQKVNLEKAFRDEDPKAIRDLLFGSEIPSWVRSDLERGGLKDWVHRKFDRERLIIEKAIQEADPIAIKILLKNPQIHPELRALLEQGGVQISIQKRLTNLRLFLKKAIETGDSQTVNLVFGHSFTPKSIREMFKAGALQPQIKLEIGEYEKLLIVAFLKADPQAIKQLKVLGVAKTKLPADFTIAAPVQESRTQVAIKQLLEKASEIRSEFLTRRTLLTRAIQNDDEKAIKTLCPDCITLNAASNKSAPANSNSSTATTNTLETSNLPESLKIYLQNGGFRRSIKAKYAAQYQLLEQAINSGDMTQVLSLLENPKLPSDVTVWITKLNLSDVATGEARAASLQKVKNIIDGLQQTEIKKAVLVALEIVNLTLAPLEVSELESLIAKQVLENASNQALPTFDAAASKIQTRAVDVALQGALIALTVNEKNAGNAAVQTLIDRAQTELTKKAPKTINKIFTSTLKTARSDARIMRQNLERVIETVSQAQRETFIEVLRKSFAFLALLSLLGVGLTLIRPKPRAVHTFELEA